MSAESSLFERKEDVLYVRPSPEVTFAIDDVIFAHHGVVFRFSEGLLWDRHPQPVREGHVGFCWEYAAAVEAGEDAAGGYEQYDLPMGTGNPGPDVILRVRVYPEGVPAWTAWLVPQLDAAVYHTDMVGGLRIRPPRQACPGSWIEREYTYHTYAPTGTWGHLRPLRDVFRGLRQPHETVENAFPPTLGYMCWYRDPSGKAAAVMPLTGAGCFSYMRASRQGPGIEIIATGLDGTAVYTEPIPLVAAAADDDTEAATARIFQIARHVMPRLRLRHEKPRPVLLDGLGYSDYVATGYWSKRTEQTSEKTIVGVLEAGAPLDWVVDISAQSLFGHGRAARKHKAYGDIKRIVDRIKNEYGVTHAGAWVHSFVGAAADNPLYEDHPEWFTTTNNGTLFPDLANPAAGAYFDEGCAMLAELGFDHFKLDFPMFGFEQFGNRMPLEKVFRVLYRWWQDACQKHGLTIIGCQGLLNEVWGQFDKVNLARVSADWHASMLPTVSGRTPSGGPVTPAGIDRSTRHHVVDSFFIAHYLKHVFWPDFDMIQTHDRDARAYAVMAAMSGGLVYLTDEPQLHQHRWVDKLMLGRRVGRVDATARPLERQFFANPTAPSECFWVSTTAGGTAVAAAFNLSEDRAEVQARLPEEFIPSGCGSAVIWSHFARRGARWTKGQDPPPVTLQFAEAEVFTIAPLERDRAAVIGLIDKLISPAGVTLERDGDGWIVSAEVDGEVALAWPWDGAAAIARGRPADVSLADNLLRVRVEAAAPCRLSRPQ